MRWREKKYRTRLHIIEKNFLKLSGKINHKQRVLRRRSKVEVKVPRFFSLAENTEKTLRCLNALNELIEHIKNRNEVIKVNSLDVKDVDPAALMYLVAILFDAREKHVLVKGNYPKDEDAKKLFIRYGFHNFVKNNNGNKKICIQDMDMLQITEGREISPENSQKICEFAEKHDCFLEENKSSKANLYTTLIEMMGNVRQHAYKETGRWLTACEFKSDGLEFLFFDRGQGIPTTVQNNWSDVFKKFLGKEESYILKSALKGEFRTQTKEKNRGKGLPQIYEFLKSPIIDKAVLFSGHGYCEIENSSISINRDFREKLHGTLYRWKIKGAKADEKHKNISS
ncbi:MAG: hypothetical protein KH231_04535 [Dialister sp.]|uniref:hypothetical protein n=1 Tax=Dialister sp. TaxID=1955814 RepID=UPI001DFE7417|nr:hypothetical protein [Dialister sp.]MBS6714727.1 hypothetical protein [Dialister sp.]